MVSPAGIELLFMYMILCDLLCFFKKGTIKDTII